MTTTSSKRLTADDLLALPRGYGRRYELIRGVLVEKPGTGDSHAMVLVWFTNTLANYVASDGYGDLRVGEPGYLLDLDPDTVRCPDLAWIAPGRIPPGTRGYPNLAPIWQLRSSLQKTPTLKWRPRRGCGSATARNKCGWPTRRVPP